MALHALPRSTAHKQHLSLSHVHLEDIAMHLDSPLLQIAPHVPHRSTVSAVRLRLMEIALLAIIALAQQALTRNIHVPVVRTAISAAQVVPHVLRVMFVLLCYALFDSHSYPPRFFTVLPNRHFESSHLSTRHMVTSKRLGAYTMRSWQVQSIIRIRLNCSLSDCWCRFICWISWSCCGHWTV